jgi:hypothetical protein
MQLTSSSFHDGGAIPRRYTCDGENLSPPLAWTAPPKGARSFALVCTDPDAPGGTWHHWAIFDIAPDRRGLAEHFARSDDPEGPKQAKNDFRKIGYDGPCPPPGHGAHRYQFRLIALSVEHLPVQAHPSCAAVTVKAEEFALAEAELVGRYER